MKSIVYFVKQAEFDILGDNLLAQLQNILNKYCEKSNIVCIIMQDHHL